MGNYCSLSFQNVTSMLLANLFNNFHLLVNPQKVNFVLLSFNDDTVEQYILPPFYRQNMKVERTMNFQGFVLCMIM